MMNEFVRCVESYDFSGAMEVFNGSSEELKFEMANRRFKKKCQRALHIFHSHRHISELLKYNSAINEQDDALNTPLIKATKRCKINVVELLLSYGADVNVKTSCGRTALTIAGDSGWHEGFVAILNSNPVILADQHDVIAHDNPEIVRAMVKHLSDTNRFTPYASSTYMYVAVHNNDIGLVDVVLKNTPDLSVVAERKLYVRSNEMAAFLTSRKIGFSIYYPIVDGLMLPIQIYLLYHVIDYDDMKHLLHSPKYIEIFELFIAMGSREEIRDRVSLICNLQLPENYGRIERVEWIAEVSGVVSSSRPSLINVSYFQLKCYQIRERMSLLKKRIELSQVTGDWRILLS